MDATEQHKRIPPAAPAGPPAAAPAAVPRVPGRAVEPHALTVTLEEYFHGAALAGIVRRRHWHRFESRVAADVDGLLGLLDRHGARATFFVLGLVAERSPEVVARIAAAGHEIAASGYWPRAVGRLRPGEFATDLDRAAAAIAAAGGGTVRGYRAPRWLRPSDLWVLEVLARKGYAYDASLCPVGWRFAGRPELCAVRHHAPGIFEVPVSSVAVAGFRVPVAGGGALRQLPHAWLSRALQRRAERRPEPLVFELASWELDPGQPRITAAPVWRRVRHYRNLARTRERLEHHLARHRFVPVAEVLGLPPVVAPPALLPEAARAARAVPAAAGAAASAAAAAAAQPVSLVVPMHDEAENVPGLLRALDRLAGRTAGRYRFEWVFVDDGSRDATWETLQRTCAGRERVRLLRHEQNRGVAAAILTGVRAASAEIVCTIDCDCSYDPAELQHMLPLLGDAAMVTASPYHPRGLVVGVPRWRLGLSRGLSWLYRRLLRADLHTWTSCCRVLRREAVRDLELEHGGFLGVAELTVRVLRRGGAVREHPALLESRLLGASKMKTLRTIRGHLGLLWQVVRGRIR